MPGVARIGDKTKGRTTGEHHGHDPAHGAGTLNGTITGSCSDFVFVNGKKCCILGDKIAETDNCGPGTGTCSHGSSFVFINGKAIPRIGDATSPHNGWANIITGSSNVFIDK